MRHSLCVGLYDYVTAPTSAFPGLSANSRLYAIFSFLLLLAFRLFLSPSAPSTTVQFDWIYSIQQQLDDCISKGLTLLDDYAITYTGYTYGHTGIHAYMYTVHACIGYISYSWYRVKSSAYLQPTDYGCMCVYNYLLLP